MKKVSTTLKKTEYGTREELMIELKDKIKVSKNLIEIEAAIRDYWNHADNIAARKQSISDKESYEGFMNRRAEDAIRSDWALTKLENIAKEKPLAAQKLNHVLAARLQNGDLTPEQKQFVINALTGNYAKGRQGRLISVSAFHTDLQLAQAVFAVRVGTDGAYSFTGSGGSPKNAFEVVATCTGKDFERVKKAWHSAKVLRLRLKGEKNRS
jgi:hypothetical protein